MSQNYTQLKVSELKSILQERGLSHSGTKSELISRLVDHDSSTGEADKKEGSAEAPEAPEATTESAKPEEPANTEDAAAEPTTTTAEPAAESAQPTEPEKESAEKKEVAEPAAEHAEPAEEPKPTEEELFQSISEDIKIRIKRAKRFGGDSAELEARLKRLEKFGVGSILDSRAKAEATTRGSKKRSPKQLRSEGPKPAVS